MTARDYGIEYLNEFLASCVAIKLKTGETIISHAAHVEDGMSLLFPMQLIETEDGVMMKPYFPYSVDKFFYIPFDDIIFCKHELVDYIRSRYEDFCKLTYKAEIEEILFDWEENEEEYINEKLTEALDKLEVPKEAILH